MEDISVPHFVRVSRYVHRVSTNQSEIKRANITRQKRGLTGRVVATYSTGQLYEIVAKAARKAKPQAPETLSVREFDRTVASLGFPDAPSARAICGRLKRSWTGIVALALDEARSFQKLDVPERQPEAKWLTERHLFFALNTIARFKEIDSMTPADYDRYLEEFLAARKQPAHILGESARFPTSSQIIRIAATLPASGEADSLVSHSAIPKGRGDRTPQPWDRALIFAGLKPVPQVQANALTIVEAINLYIEATLCEFWPSKDELERLRDELGISIQSFKGKVWSAEVKTALDGRKEAGLPVPTMMAATSTKPPLTLPPGYIAPAKQTAKGAWEEKSDDELADALAPYVLDCIERGVRPTQKDYKSWAKGRREFPSAQTLGKRKTWGEWIAVVEAKLMEVKKAA